MWVYIQNSMTLFILYLVLCKLLLERILGKKMVARGWKFRAMFQHWLQPSAVTAGTWCSWGGKVKVMPNDASHMILSWTLEQPLACTNLSGIKGPFDTPLHLGISKKIVFNFCSLWSLSEHPFICSWHWSVLCIYATAFICVWVLMDPLDRNVHKNIAN